MAIKNQVEIKKKEGIKMINNENYKPGLALLLVEKKQYSFLNGLNNKYPLAWQKRQEYSYFEAKAFSSATIEREYYSKMAYVLWEYAEENEALKKELLQKTISFFPRYNRCKSNFIIDGKVVLTDYCAGFIISELLGNLEITPARNDLYTLIVLSVAFLFSKYENLPFENNAIKLMEDLSTAYFESMVKTKRIPAGGNTLTADEAKDAKNKVKSVTKGLIAAYNSKIDGNVYKVLPELLAILKPNMLARDSKTALYYQMNEWFNQDLFALIQDYQLTNQDIEQIFYNIIKSWTHEDVNWEDASAISDDVLEEVDTLLIHATFVYICLKINDSSRDFYWKDFKVVTTADSMVTALRAELDKVKAEKEQMLSTIQKRNQEIEAYRSKSEQLVSNAIKETRDELNAVKRDNRQKEKELEELRQYVKELENELLMAEEQLKQTEVVESTVPIEELIDKLNKPNILICPGHQNLVNKMKEVLPKAKFFELDKSYQNNVFNGVTHVFINKMYFNHGKYYKIKTVIPEAKVYRLTRTKVDLVLNEMANAMGL